MQALKCAIQDGLDSGVSDKTVPQIMEEVEARLLFSATHPSVTAERYDETSPMRT